MASLMSRGMFSSATAFFSRLGTLIHLLLQEVLRYFASHDQALETVNEMLRVAKKWVIIADVCCEKYRHLIEGNNNDRDLLKHIANLIFAFRSCTHHGLDQESPSISYIREDLVGSV